MSAGKAESDRIGSQDFFPREYFLEDIRWLVARLLGKPDPRGELPRGLTGLRKRPSH